MCRLLSLLAGLVLLFCTFKSRADGYFSCGNYQQTLHCFAAVDKNNILDAQLQSEHDCLDYVHGHCWGAAVGVLKNECAAIAASPPTTAAIRQTYAQDGLRMKQYLPLFHLAGRRLVRVL